MIFSSLIWTVTLLLQFLPMPPVGAVHLDWTERVEQLELRINWNDTVTMERIEGAEELLVRFSKPVTIPMTSVQALAATAWIEDVRLGYDTVLIKKAARVQFVANLHGTQMQVVFTSTPASEVREPDTETAFQMSLIRSRLLVAQGRLGEARSLLLKLRGRENQEAQVLASLAEIDSARRHRRSAANLFEQASRLDPENAYYRQALRGLRRVERPKLSSNTEDRDLGIEGNETRNRLDAHLKIRPAIVMHLRTETTSYEVEALRTSQGGTVEIRDISRRSELRIKHEALGANQTTFSLNLARETVGFSVRQQLQDPTNSWGWSVHYRQPTWESLEAIVHGLRFSGLHVEKNYPLRQRLDLRLASGWNQYSMPDSPVSQSMEWDGSLTLKLRDYPLFLVYGIDAEYFYPIDSGYSIAGFRPVLQPSREVHAQTVSYYASFWTMLQFSTFGGHAWDRLGGSGFFSGAQLELASHRSLSAKIWIERQLRTLDTGLKMQTLGGQFGWIF